MNMARQTITVTGQYTLRAYYISLSLLCYDIMI